jgi:transcriptional regulator with XRE-family HTH domain
MSETMGERIWRSRTELGLSQDAAAAEADISRVHWCRLEHDEEDNPRLHTLMAVACVLKVRLDWLTSGKM